MCLEFLKPDWIWWIWWNFVKHIQACSLSKFWILIICRQFYSVVMQRHRPIAHQISCDATAPPNCSQNQSWCNGTAQLLTQFSRCSSYLMMQRHRPIAHRSCQLLYNKKTSLKCSCIIWAPPVTNLLSLISSDIRWSGGNPLVDEDIFLARRKISQQTSINGVGGIAGAFCDSIRWHDPRRARNLKDPRFNCGNVHHV